MSDLEDDKDKTVKLVVFLADEERTDFKVACAKAKASMSQKARELILDWIAQQKNGSEGE